jgi:uncharacterized protein GlcG (DUF336 family)
MEKTYSKKTVTYELAVKMVEAAIARAQELGCKQNVAVVDDGGNLKAFGRMDGAPLLGIEGCQRKAFTSLFGIGTKDFYNYIKDQQGLLIGLSHFARATVVGGGLPITVDGEVIGGIGVGGGTEERLVTIRLRRFARGPVDHRISNGHRECDEIGRSDKTGALEHEE